METPEKIKEQQRKKREKRIIILTFILLIVATIVQVYYARLTFNNTPIPSNIIVFSLLNINIILILLLIFLIFRNLVKIFFDKEQKKVKKLSRKLVISFFLFTTIPLILQFGISTTIIKSSISGWFNKKVEDNLKASLKIAQDYYYDKQKRVTLYAEKFYAQFFKNRKKLDELAENLFLNGYIIGENNKILKLKCLPDNIKEKYIKPNMEKIREVVISSKKNKGSDIIYIKKKEIIYGFYKKRKIFTVVFFLTSRKITKASKTISRNFTEYSYLKLMKSPIEKTYILSLLILTMVIIFSATWFGFFIAKDISTPINKLVKVTEEISKGNLDYEINIKSQDEIKLLVESFKKMVIELKNSRKDLLERQQYIEAIINNVNSGVISINQKGIINTINPFVEKLLKIKKNNIISIHYKNIKNQILKDIIANLIEEFSSAKVSDITKNINISVESNIVMLSIYSTILKDENNDILGYLIVMTDLTQVTLAQRAAAWKEVARRVAHEIKNPLTPIQLSAQRLKKKYSNMIVENKEDFNRIINNIVQYVEVIRNLANEFSKFAKMPEIKTESHNLNNLIDDIIPFYKSSKKDINFIINFDNSLPEIHLDKKQIYQVITNILNNAVEAFADCSDSRKKEIVIKTSYNKKLKKASLVIIDNGKGIETKIIDKVFQPYFSTKKGGSGIGLTVAKSIVEGHNGEISIKRNKPTGTIITINFFNV